MAHEGMYEADNGEARTSSIADRCPATIRVPAEDLAGDVQAANSVCACGELHAARWHLEDVCSAGSVEHIRALEETRERLAILTIADKAETGVRRNFVRDATHMAAPATKREVLEGLHHKRSLLGSNPRKPSTSPREVATIPSD